MASAIPPDLVEQVEQRTDSTIVAVIPRGGGGASRQGAEVTLHRGNGEEWNCYLAWDARAADPARRSYFDRETAILAALSGPFRNSGVSVAPLIAAFPSHLALLSTLVRGRDRFGEARDKRALARDFVAQLATLHRIDPHNPAFAKLGDPDRAPSDQIFKKLAVWREANLAAGSDPILQLALAWLAQNVPADNGPAVILHGDAGPGNFLHDHDRVVALLDWELTHLGDPAEDLAQIQVRSLIQPFVPIADVLTAYADAGGRPVDGARLAFYRLYFQLGFLVPSAGSGPTNGSALLYGTLHRRVIVRSLAELVGASLEPPDLPDCVSGPDDRLFQTALDDLRSDIVPGAANERAAAKGKDLARLVKYWRRRSSHGAAFDAAEINEIQIVVPDAPQELAAARRALAMAIAERRIDFDQALQLCHNRMVRETWIMADAMGALATTWYEEHP